MRYINRYQQSKSINGAAVYHERGIAVYQQPSKTKANARLDDAVVSTWTVYKPRELYINSNHKRKRKHFWSTQPCRPGRCINRDQQSKSIYGADVSHQRGVAVYQQPSKLKRKHFWTTQPCRPWRYINHESCMSTAIRRLKRKHCSSTQPCRPGRCINRDQQSKDISDAAVYRQRSVAVYHQPSKSQAKALLDDTVMSTRVVSTAISKAKHIWRSCISTTISKAKAYLSCISTAFEHYGESTSRRHSVSTSAVYQPLSTYPAKLYITSAV